MQSRLSFPRICHWHYSETKQKLFFFSFSLQIGKLYHFLGPNALWIFDANLYHSMNDISISEQCRNMHILCSMSNTFLWNRRKTAFMVLSVSFIVSEQTVTLLILTVQLSCKKNLNLP